MTAVAEPPSLVAGYGAFEESLAPHPPWLAALRRRGLERFDELGFPSIRQEAWRYTNVAPIARGSFRHQPGALHGLTRERLAPFLIPGCIDLVFVNGAYSEALSTVDTLPPGVFAGSLARALEEVPERLEPHLGRYAELGDHPFLALNTAHISDGGFVHVPRGVAVAKPLHLLFLATAGDEPTVSYPRNLIVVEESGELTVLESYGGLSGERYFTCPVTELVGGPASVIDHYKLEQESVDAFHIAFQKVFLERAANFFSHAISHGGALVRNDVQAYLDGEGIDCTLNGLYLVRGRQHVDTQMKVDHARPHCNSYELYKGVLEEQARAVFNGLIHVHRGAQKTDAKQSNRNLLLSREAVAHSNPQLLIFADDVRCTHGSTVGQLDEEALFYLRSRGIGADAAKSLLTYAFAAEVLAEIRLDEVRKDVEEFLFTRLPKGEVVRQAV